MRQPWITETRFLVRWADGTYDSVRGCDQCGRHDCEMPVIKDRYKEVGKDHYFGESNEDSAKTYWNWTEQNAPVAHVNGLGERIYKETPYANSDSLPAIEAPNSGIPEYQHSLAQEAYNHLTEKQKAVWNLVMREQLSHSDAAAKLGISRQAIEDRLLNATTTFRNFLEGKLDVSNG